MEELQEYVAFDLEFNHVEDTYHLLQVSAVRFNQGQEVGHFDSYVASSVPVSGFLTGLTGITRDKLLAAPPVEEVLVSFQAFIGDSPLIGYNGIESDIPVLQSHGLDLADQYRLDVFHLAQDLRSTYLHGTKGLKLKEVANHLGIEGRGHNSLEDARMTALVYEALLELQANEAYLQQEDQEDLINNPFASLGLLNFFDQEEEG